MLNSVKSLSASTLDHVDETFSTFTPITRLARRLNLRPSYLLLAFFIATIAFLAAGIFSHLCVTLFGMIYPSYMTFKVVAVLRRHWRPRMDRRPRSG